MGTTFWIGAAIGGTISTDIEIHSLVIVTVATPSFWCDLDMLPNDATEISVVLVANSLTIPVDLNEH